MDRDEAAAARRRPLRGQAALRRVLHPQSIALIGATTRAGAFGDRVMANLHRFTGRIYPVNARYERIGERICYPDLAALPEVPDAVVIAVGREAVEAQVLACAERGAGGVLVYASGYTETGKPGRDAEQARLADIARRHRLPIVGPNCIGLVNYLNGAAMTFSGLPDQAPPGSIDGAPAAKPIAIGIVSQSGALGFAQALAVRRGVAVSHVLTSGNSCDIDMADYIAYLAEEPGCAAIACLFEGMAEPARLLAAAELARAAGKPLVVCKLAVSEVGARASLSHTGSLAGSHAAYCAALTRAGAILVDKFEALVETACFFAKAPPPLASGIAVAATSGGAAIMAADKAELHGVALPQPADATRAVLEAHIPEFGSARNPCDVTAQVLTDPESLNACARALLGDPAYGVLVSPWVYAYAPATARIPVLSAIARDAGKVVCNVWANEWLEGPGALEAESDPHTALFRSMDRCFATLALWLARGDGRAPAAEPRLSPPDAATAAAAMLRAATGRTIGERVTKQVLSAYGVAVVPERLVTTAAAAMAAATELGLPVALKIESPELPHKTEAGVIRLGLRSAAEVGEAFEAVMANARRAGATTIAGAVVQPMVPAGVEVMVGGRIDPQFGPLIVVGLGGVLVELLRDSAVGLAPVTSAEAAAMLAGLKGAKLLDGFRGAPAVERAALCDAIVRISEFIADHAAMLAELDVNPLICAGSRVIAVDGLIVMQQGADQ